MNRSLLTSSMPILECVRETLRDQRVDSHNGLLCIVTREHGNRCSPDLYVLSPVGKLSRMAELNLYRRFAIERVQTCANRVCIVFHESFPTECTEPETLPGYHLR